MSDNPNKQTIRIGVDASHGDVIIYLPAPAEVRGLTFQIIKIDPTPNEIRIGQLAALLLAPQEKE